MAVGVAGKEGRLVLTNCNHLYLASPLFPTANHSFTSSPPQPHSCYLIRY